MNRADARCIELAGLELPEDSPHRRDHVRRPERHTPHYLARFDRRTLFYDLVWQADRNRHVLTAPPFSNLWPILRDGLRRGGSPARPRRRRGAKYDQAVLVGPSANLSLQLEDNERPLAVREDIAHLFDGLNCAVTMNRDNPFDFACTWADHHVRLHGLQGVLIFDNGSTTYRPGELADALATVPGLRQVVVASAPYPYGTTDKVQRGEVRPNYLQPAMLNLARTDILRRARAVLNADFDELVLARSADSVFDVAARRWSGAARLPVYWADPAPGTEGPVGQRAHVWRSDPRVRTPRKWCAQPGGPLSRLGWHVHHVGGEAFKLLAEDTAHEVVHCRATSTGWNPFKMRAPPGDVLVRDPELAALWASTDDAP